MVNPVLTALLHVREHHPNVVTVEYDEAGRWLYKNADGSAPIFNGEVNVSVLEDASDSVNCACVFSILAPPHEHEHED